MKLLFTTILTFTVLLGFTQIPNGYYDSAAGLTGENLRTELHNIIDDHNVQSYSSLWTHFNNTDKRTNGTVWDMYSDNPSGSPAYSYNFGSDQCGSYNSEADCYNREHSFPSSWFNSNAPMDSDLFHLYPTDGYVNGQRSNYPFGEVASATWTSTNGCKVGVNSYPGYSGLVFEPIDEYKGDFARTYFYMVTRYKDVASSFSSAALQGDNLSTWTRNMMMAWHVNDPVSAKETDRNNAVYQIQNNRNPYIDHPEWVDSIWTSTVGVEERTISEVKMWSSENSIYIERDQSTEGQLAIFNLLGQPIAFFKISHAEASKLLTLNRGIYIAVFSSPNELKVLRFMQH
jgi:endonuclease I